MKTMLELRQKLIEERCYLVRKRLFKDFRSDRKNIPKVAVSLEPVFFLNNKCDVGIICHR